MNIDKYRLAAIPIEFPNQKEKKNYSNHSIQKEMDFCGPESHLRKVQYQIWNPHQISKSKKKNIEIGQETMKLYLN